MRESKFRAWDKVAHSMFYGIDFRVRNREKKWFGLQEFFSIIESEPEGRHDLMQYIGLKDRKDKEIYEGDIVEYHMYHDPECLNLLGTYRIFYKELAFQFEDVVTKEVARFIPTECLRVIGNIYENPDLCKKNQ